MNHLARFHLPWRNIKLLSWECELLFRKQTWNYEWDCKETRLTGAWQDSLSTQKPHFLFWAAVPKTPGTLHVICQVSKAGTRCPRVDAQQAAIIWTRMVFIFLAEKMAPTWHCVTSHALGPWEWIQVVSADGLELGWWRINFPIRSLPFSLSGSWSLEPWNILPNKTVIVYLKALGTCQSGNMTYDAVLEHAIWIMTPGGTRDKRFY
jgi:hypothetical protein